MIDLINMTNKINSFIRRRKSVGKYFKELIKKFAGDLLLARLRHKKDDKIAFRKVATSDVVGARPSKQVVSRAMAVPRILCSF